MSRAPSTFKQRDLAAALRVAQAAGLKVARVEIGRDGRIVMVTGAGESACPEQGNEWDEVLRHDKE